MQRMVSEVIPALVLLCFSINVCALDSLSVKPEISKYLEEAVEQADIPGLSAVVISEGTVYMLNYGHANKAKNEKVTSKTLFQLGSCSKAFTALAVMYLESQGQLCLDDNVSYYLPWFKVEYNGKIVPIKVRHLLHHTSGIPWNTIAQIPETNEENALEKTVKTLVGVTLNARPGKQFEYATINYDVLALIMQKITKQTFEDYMHTMFRKLSLKYTTVGVPVSEHLMATGYKIGFFSAREYSAPVFKGNNAAGYIISNAEDMAKWLQLQLGLPQPPYDTLIKQTHQRNESVYPQGDMSSYAKGWRISLRGDGEISHDGLNPNFTSFVGLIPGQKSGVVVLANSNSNYTKIIGENVLKLLSGREFTESTVVDDNNDRVYSAVSFLLATHIIVVFVLLLIIARDVFRRRRQYTAARGAIAVNFVLSLVILLPFLYGIYKIPAAMAGFTWQSTFVWTPVSFKSMILLLLGALLISYITYLTSLCFPEKNKLKRMAPQILMVSLLSGLANMAIILLVTSSLNSTTELEFILLYYVLALFLYLFGRRYVQVNLIKSTRDLVYELSLKLTEKIFSTTYQKFEKIDRGRVYTALNDDVGAIGDSINMFVIIITSLFTATGAFIYLASIAFWATAITIALVLILTSIYYTVTKRTNKYFEEARDSRNTYMSLVNGMIDGFKEISLHRNKKLEYKADIAASANEYRVKISTANIRFVNASLIGESVLILVLGVVAFAFKKIFPGIGANTIMSFVIVLLYLIGPVNTILNAAPMVMRFKIAWNRVQQFLKEIPASIDLKALTPILTNPSVGCLKVEGVTFRYTDKNDSNGFSIGPIDFEVRKGEILFIVGGNGSGKTTLAKLLTGLYIPDEGKIMIDDEVIPPSELSEKFSAVFNPIHLFGKLYNVRVESSENKISSYLKVLNLDKKLEIDGNAYSTIDLSGGQRKRLGLLQCYLEDSPIYLFDEWAADQDPEYRNFFYKVLLPEMRAAGKIVIAVTHDDHYFDTADKVLKMNHGKLEYYSNDYLVQAD